jgi:acetylglutamate kinase
MVRVIKLGGNEIDDPLWLAQLVAVVQRFFEQNEIPVLVHGGGMEVGQLQAALGGEPQFIGGLRVTDKTALRAATMVLCGEVSTRLVAALGATGLDALGMSGVDRELVLATPLAHPDGSLGFVGMPLCVRSDVLRDLLQDGVVPVVAPICSNGLGGWLNVNADVMAGSIAVTMNANEVIFISNVPGVLVAGSVAPRLTAAETAALIEQGVISGGMIPKVTTALIALKQGVKQVRITSIDDVLGGTVFE